MKSMKRTVSKKSHSWWWHGHTGPNSSRWLADNLDEMDRLVKEMLKLIEEEGDSFAKKAEMYYQRRPELVGHVESFYRMYRALAERYDHAAGELRRSIPPGIQSQGSVLSSDLGSEPPSPSPSPPPTAEQIARERRMARSRSRARAAGFAFFLGRSGSRSDSAGGSDGSSSETESESETGGDCADRLCPRVMELESELRELKEKLQRQEAAEEEQRPDRSLLPSRAAELEAELAAADEKLEGSQQVIEQLKQELEKNAFEERSFLEPKIAEDERRQLAAAAAAAAGEGRSTAELRRNLDAARTRLRELASEKEELGAMVSALTEAAQRRDAHLQELQATLEAAAESARAEGRAMMSGRVAELEAVVERQKAAISDGAEKKREAIRQLCFSLEHYRDGYTQLRRALLVHGRLPAAVAAS